MNCWVCRFAVISTCQAFSIRNLLGCFCYVDTNVKHVDAPVPHHTQFYVYSGVENHLYCGVWLLSSSSQHFPFGCSGRAVTVCLAGQQDELWGAAVSGWGALLALLSLCFTGSAFGSSKCRAEQKWGTALGGHSQPGRSMWDLHCLAGPRRLGKYRWRWINEKVS